MQATAVLLLLTCVQTLCDGGGIDQEAAAQGAADVGVELVQRELGLWGRERNTVSG